MKKITLLIMASLMLSLSYSQTYLNESFETAVPPTGWIDVAGANADEGNLWVQSAVLSNTGGNSAKYDDFNADNDRWLISPAMDLSGATTPEFTYYDNVNFASFAAVQDVLYSTDYTGSGDPTLATWTSVNAVIGTEDTWVLNGPYALPLSATVYVAFHYNGNFAAEWYIDDILVQEAPLCTEPMATYTVVDDCAVSGGFLIDVEVTDLGDATSLTISDDQGSATQSLMATGTVQFGPYTNATDVVITVGHDQDSVCDIMSGALTQAACPPSNDNFANAAPIDCSSGTITGSTSLATLDEDDAPDGGGADMDAPNVWYSLDSSIDGASDVTINLCGSSYDTSVLIYTGTSGNLTFVAANDDNTAACGQCCQSLVTFPTDGTSTYYIAVEGYNAGNVGDFEMVISCVTATPPPANDECVAAEALTTGVSVSGTTVGATTSPGDAPTCDLFGSVADAWYSYEITGGVSDLSITTTITGTSDQANVALYDDCAALQANSLGCSDANGGETLSVTGLSVGTYYIRVWSDGNAPEPPVSGRVEGTFDIVVNASLSTGSFENEAAFNYYPNPVQNTVTLNAQNTIENVIMYNMLGQEVLRATPNAVNSELDMSNLQDGAYFVKVTIANVTKTIRVIKQ